MLKTSPNTDVLSRYKIKIEDNVLSINSSKKAYVSIDKITAVELYNGWVISGLFFGIFVILSGLIVYYLINFILIPIIAIIMGTVIIVGSLFSFMIKIYAVGYKPITIQGSSKSMKELYEELKKLV
ncbi:hypothetical protein [Methanococcus voltae]|uniref:Uncharacterized protein n=1 Tax=Methanococcus voltae (strain ATCC BAA-1334 / A3) TaxID=456320 RepID=D7DQR5_METV3|nr:hypothetical protein [Methanococcus voltae]MCS3900852.1 hypothetical protein [Methanococcus voltae]